MSGDCFQRKQKPIIVSSNIVSDDVGTSVVLLLQPSSTGSYDKNDTSGANQLGQRPWWPLTGGYFPLNNGKQYACHILGMCLKPDNQPIC